MSIDSGQRSARRGHFAGSLLLLLILSFSEAWADPPDPEAWFRNEYGPVWKDVSAELAGKIKAFYHAEVTVHEPGGERITHNTSQWVDELLTLWSGEGWLGSSVPDIRTHRINDTTATRWLDLYTGGESEFSCGWYLADYIDGQWQFTHYAEMDCASQDF